MNTRAKFLCTEDKIQRHYNSTTHVYEDLHTYGFIPVTGTSEENKTFFKWTPSGSLSMGVLNPNVSFEIGKSYYLDFTLVED